MRTASGVETRTMPSWNAPSIRKEELELAQKYYEYAKSTYERGILELREVAERVERDEKVMEEAKRFLAAAEESFQATEIDEQYGSHRSDGGPRGDYEDRKRKAQRRAARPPASAPGMETNVVTPMKDGRERGGSRGRLLRQQAGRIPHQTPLQLPRTDRFDANAAVSGCFDSTIDEPGGGEDATHIRTPTSLPAAKTRRLADKLKSCAIQWAREEHEMGNEIFGKFSSRSSNHSVFRYALLTTIGQCRLEYSIG